MRSSSSSDTPEHRSPNRIAMATRRRRLRASMAATCAVTRATAVVTSPVHRMASADLAPGTPGMTKDATSRAALWSRRSSTSVARRWLARSYAASARSAPPALRWACQAVSVGCSRTSSGSVVAVRTVAARSGSERTAVQAARRRSRRATKASRSASRVGYGSCAGDLMRRRMRGERWRASATVACPLVMPSWLQCGAAAVNGYFRAVPAGATDHAAVRRVRVIGSMWLTSA